MKKIALFVAVALCGVSANAQTQAALDYQQAKAAYTGLHGWSREADRVWRGKRIIVHVALHDRKLARFRAELTGAYMEVFAVSRAKNPSCKANVDLALTKLDRVARTYFFKTEVHIEPSETLIIQSLDEISKVNALMRDCPGVESETAGNVARAAALKEWEGFPIKVADEDLFAP